MIFYLIVLDLYTHDPHKNEIPLSDISERTRINATRPCWEVQNGWGANIEVLRLVIQINGQVQTANCKLMGVGLSGKWVAASCEPQT